MTNPRIIAGIDEAGRGALAGPVVACCVVFKPHFKDVGILNDSKQLSPSKRYAIYTQILPYIEFGIGLCTHRQIDRTNILRATLLAMQKSARRCLAEYDHIIVDGNRKPNILGSIETQVKADARIPEVQAASIMAKVIRDQIMTRYHDRYPHYGFHQHAGYGTKNHYHALSTHGPCPIHRKGFNLNRQLTLWS